MYFLKICDFCSRLVLFILLELLIILEYSLILWAFVGTVIVIPLIFIRFGLPHPYYDNFRYWIGDKLIWVYIVVFIICVGFVICSTIFDCIKKKEKEKMIKIKKNKKIIFYSDISE